jgi:hypothetical protein
VAKRNKEADAMTNFTGVETGVSGLYDPPIDSTPVNAGQTPMKSILRLSAQSVKANNIPGRYLDGQNLYLQIRPNGTKCWIFRYSIRHRDRINPKTGKRRQVERQLGLGGYRLFYFSP